MRPLPSTTRLSHHRCTSITVLLGEAGQPGYSPLETCGCKQFPVWGWVGEQLQKVERNNLFSCTRLPSKSVGCQVIFLILLLINIKARIQALFYFIIPHHIPLLWCHFFPVLLASNMHLITMCDSIKPYHTKKKMTANIHALLLMWSCQVNRKQNKNDIQECLEVSSINCIKGI